VAEEAECGGRGSSDGLPPGPSRTVLEVRPDGDEALKELSCHELKDEDD
jgi:hypothetical protein